MIKLLFIKNGSKSYHSSIVTHFKSSSLKTTIKSAAFCIESLALLVVS